MTRAATCAGARSRRWCGRCWAISADSRRSTAPASTGNEDELVVEDGGPGLPDRDDLFEPFVSADADVRGTGLGLHIVQSIVERLGAQLETGASDGGGARFTVRF